MIDREKEVTKDPLTRTAATVVLLGVGLVVYAIFVYFWHLLAPEPWCWMDYEELARLEFFALVTTWLMMIFTREWRDKDDV